MEKSNLANSIKKTQYRLHSDIDLTLCATGYTLYLELISTLLEIINCFSFSALRIRQCSQSVFIHNFGVTQPFSDNTGRAEVEVGVSPGWC